MSVIIRLQNLPWSANALDIRAFFRGLSIPDGGVHIVGGEMGDAFIAFSTDEDARQAMMLDRGKINEVQIRLLLSSRAEMQKVIEQARQQSLAMMQITPKPPQIVQQSTPKTLTTPQPPIITSTSLQNILSQQKVSFNNENSTQSYQSVVQSYSDNSMDSRDSRDKTTDHTKSNDRGRDRDRDYSKSRDKDRYGRNSRSRSRSRSRDRRRSRSRDRDRSNRRRGHRSRSRSPDRRNRRRRSRDRSRDRDRQETKNGRDRSHSRSRSHSYDRDRGRDRNFDIKDKKFNTNKEIKDDKITPKKFPESINKTDVISRPNPWETIKQTMPLQTPVFTTNYGQGFGACQTQQPPPNTPVLSNFPSIPSNSISQLQQLQQPQSQLQNQLLIQQNVSQLLQNQLKSTAFQSLLNSSLSSTFNYGLLNSNSSPDFKSSDAQNVKTFQNPYNVDKKQSTTTTEQNPLNRITNFSGLFPHKNTSENNFEKNKDRRESSHSQRNDYSQRDSSRRDYNSESSKQDKYSNKLSGNCIKVSNMCPGTTYSDIRKFFSGLYIANNGIKMINDKHGYRVGTAYIRFVKEESKPRAFVKNGTILKNKSIVIENVTEKEFDEAVDSFKPNKWSKYQDSQDDSRVRDSDKDDRITKEIKDFTTLLLEDIPAFATEQDIMKMFSLYTVIDIILTRQTSGKKQYIAYVKFHRIEDAEKAFSDKMKHAIGHKQIFVSPCSDAEFEKAKNIHTMGDSEDQSEDMEIQEIDNSEDIKTDNSKEKPEDEPIIIDSETTNEKNETKKEETPNKNDDSENNTKDENESKNLSKIEQNTQQENNETKETTASITITTTTTTAAVPAIPKVNETPKIPSLLSLAPINPGDPRQRNKDIVTKYVHLRNCDYKATKMDIIHFFGKLNLTPVRIEFLKNVRGQPNGELIIEFNNSQDAEKSLTNYNALCNSRRIKIDLISSQFVADKLGDDFLDETNNTSNKSETQNTNDSTNNETNLGNRVNSNDTNNVPLKKDNNGTTRQRPSRFSDINDTTNTNNSLNNNGNNRNRFNNNTDCRGISGGGNLSGDNNRKDVGSRPTNMQNDNNNFRSRMPGTISDASVNQFGKPGCVISLENVPYKAGIEDILEFFHRFNVQPQNVIRRYNDDGTPTGDARVAFTSPLEAQQALKAKNKQKIFNRTIFLSIV